MDTNAGRFVEEAQAEKWMQHVEVGEVIKIKGEDCRVTAIGDREITLQLMSADDRLRDAFDDLRAADQEGRRREIERGLSQRGAGFIGGAPNRGK